MSARSEGAPEKILVTGAGGFLGVHLCRSLVAQGAEVHGLSRVKRPPHELGVQWWKGDLSSFDCVQALMRDIRPTVVFHLASQVTGSRELAQVLPTFTSNLSSTVHLMTCAATLGVRRLIVAGSMEEPDPRDAESVPGSPYAASKLAASGYARMFFSLYRLPVVLVRIFMVYGPQQNDLSKLVPYVILSLLKGNPPKLASGSRLVDWVYVEDVTRALTAALSTPDIEGRTVDIGSGHLVSIRQIVEHIVKLTQTSLRPEFGALADRPLEQERVANTARTKALLGWSPQVTLEEGLTRTIDWYREYLQCRDQSEQALQ